MKTWSPIEKKPGIFFHAGDSISVLAEATDNLKLEGMTWKVVALQKGEENLLGDHTSTKKIQLGTKPNFPNLKYRDNPQVFLILEAKDPTGNLSHLEFNLFIRE